MGNYEKPQRPEWIVCVKHDIGPHGEPGSKLQLLRGKTWCGRYPAFDFVFVNPTHAAYNGLVEGQLVTCPECYEAIVKALGEGVEEARTAPPDPPEEDDDEDAA